MIAVITVPGRDYKLITRYINKHKIEPDTLELLGRTYETGFDDYVVTATVMKDKPSIHYTVSFDDVVLNKMINSPICYFSELGMTVLFDVDKLYE
jgi:hypothetical protein